MTRFVVHYPSQGAVIVAGRQTVMGRSPPGARVDVLLRIDGVQGLQAKLVADSSGQWRADFLMTPGTYVLHGWVNREQISVPVVMSGAALPPDFVVTFAVWEVKAAYG